MNKVKEDRARVLVSRRYKSARRVEDTRGERRGGRNKEKKKKTHTDYE